VFACTIACLRNMHLSLPQTPDATSLGGRLAMQPALQRVSLVSCRRTHAVPCTSSRHRPSMPSTRSRRNALLLRAQPLPRHHTLLPRLLPRLLSLA
jgi:hypothetical protein